MANELEALLPEVAMNAPYPAADVDELVADFVGEIGPIPHQDYLDFMRRHAGGAGPVGSSSYLTIWPLEEVIWQTENFNKTEPASKLLLFAGDGGDTAFAFDRGGRNWPIISLSMTSVSPEDRKQIALTFSEFIKRLASDELPI